MPTVIVYTPEGYQVTDAAMGKLMQHFGCDVTIHPWRKDYCITPGALHITDQECKRGMIVADPQTGGLITDVIVLSIYEAMATADSKIAKAFSGEQFAAEERALLDALIATCHSASYAAGWWHHPDTGRPYIPGDKCSDETPWIGIAFVEREMIIHYWPFVVATKIGLFHSEVSEGFEAFRRGLRDDKLAHRLGLETEIADTMIRQFDLAGAFKRANALGVVDASTHEMDLSASFFEKLNFNRTREDHKVAARRAAGGKYF